MFTKAEREKIYLKIAMTGTSGSGKSYSSLLIARGLAGNGKLAMIDTENGSGSLYADLVEYDVVTMTAPFTVDKYSLAIIEAVKQKYDVLIMDSITHAWAELLLEKEQIDLRGGNSFTNWAKISPKHKFFIDAILQSKIHIVATMRSKQEYVIEQNEKGKAAPRKIGMAPVQREGMEYEFTTVFDMAQNHTCMASKDRTGLFDNKIFVPTIQTGEEIRAWLSGRKEKLEKPNTLTNQNKPTPAQLDYPSGNPITVPPEQHKFEKELDLNDNGKDKIFQSDSLTKPIYGVCPKCGGFLLKSNKGDCLYCFMFTQKQCDYVRKIRSNETLRELDKVKYPNSKLAFEFYNQPIQQDLSTDIPF